MMTTKLRSERATMSFCPCAREPAQAGHHRGDERRDAEAGPDHGDGGDVVLAELLEIQRRNGITSVKPVADKVAMVTAA